MNTATKKSPVSSFQSPVFMRGFTLLETLVGVSVFTVVALSVYQGYRAADDVSRRSRLKITALALANEQLEIVRNLPYADVGISGSVPPGKVPRAQELTRAGARFVIQTTVRNLDDPFDGTLGGIPNDTAPADYKLVELAVSCSSCRQFVPFTVTTTVAPRALETATGNGALVVRVFDANGQPVPGAAVHIENRQQSPAIVIDDTTNTAGVLQIVDTPPGVEAYEITVTKTGYSTDRTYPTGVPENPNPEKPHATVVTSSVTQVSFAVDVVSTLTVTSVTDACAPVDSVAFSLRGAKRIGTNPDVLKYDVSHLTDLDGRVTIGSLEWDTYSVLLASATVDLRGSIPLLPLSVSPNAALGLQLVVAPKEPLSLLVMVKDAATQLPLADASVSVTAGGSTSTLATGRGYLRQTNWAGGGGQEDFVDPTRYLSADATVATAGPAGELRLTPGATAGELTSSTFDAGAGSEFHQILWQPQDQPPEAGPDALRFQVATNKNRQAAWVFKGPDGTKNTFYTLANNTINPNHNGDRYLRYKVFLGTVNASVTPNLAEVAVTFTSACIPPGQVLFRGLSAGDYALTVSRAGYQTFTDTVTVASGWQQREVLFSPQ